MSLDAGKVCASDNNRKDMERKNYNNGQVQSLLQIELINHTLRYTNPYNTSCWLTTFWDTAVTGESR